MTYSKNVRDLCIAEGEQVWIVDFSIPPTSASNTGAAGTKGQRDSGAANCLSRRRT